MDASGQRIKLTMTVPYITGSIKTSKIAADDSCGPIDPLVDRTESDVGPSANQTSTSRDESVSSLIAPTTAIDSTSVGQYPKKVTLRWKEHHDFLADGIVEFMRHQCQADANVTYTSPAGLNEELKVHRLILSVFLPSIKRSLDAVGLPAFMTKLDLSKLAKEAEDVRKLIEFIYTGRATVSTDRVDSLRRLAGALCFQGLMNTIDEDKRNPGKLLNTSSNPVEESTLDTSVNPIDMCDAVISKDDSESELLQPEAATKDTPVPLTAPLTESNGDRHMSEVEESAEPPVKKYRCKLCSKQFKHAAFLRQHRINDHRKVMPISSIQTESHCQPEMHKPPVRHSSNVKVVVRPTFIIVHRNQCEKCGRRCASIKKLRQHISAVHVGKVAANCRWCYVKLFQLDEQ